MCSCLAEWPPLLHSADLLQRDVIPYDALRLSLLQVTVRLEEFERAGWPWLLMAGAEESLGL